MSSTRFSSWPVYSDEECKVVSDVLSSGKVNYWTGEIGRLFEKGGYLEIGTLFFIYDISYPVKAAFHFYCINQVINYSSLLKNSLDNHFKRKHIDFIFPTITYFSHHNKNFHDSIMYKPIYNVSR